MEAYLRQRLLVLLLIALASCRSDAASAAVTVCEAHWTDRARGDRDVPVRIRMPAGESRVPLILFSHGLGGSLESGTLWTEHWAEAGFAVVNLQHAGSDRSIIGKGMADAMTAEQLIARARDVGFVLTTLAHKQSEGDCNLARIDLSRVGMAGHSFGAITTQAVAGEAYPAGTLRDGRVDAAVAFSPSPPVRGSPDAAFGRIDIPFFSITGTEDSVPFGRAFEAASRLQPYRAMPAGGKYLLVLGGVDHLALGGRAFPFRRMQTASPEVRGLIEEATTDFWRWSLLGDETARSRLDRFAQRLRPGDRFEAK